MWISYHSMFMDKLDMNIALLVFIDSIREVNEEKE